MPGPETAYSKTFTVADRHELEAALDREAEAAVAAASRLGTGVLVTRLDARTFTVEASREAPPGLIHERDLFD
ncbi:hypothetical protein [Sinomonas sp.]|jgi:hypothetical protein|uniref:hypothetical protein n=1 Tax=Sinomonas sp. TaxID=1914986 RepID=UPI002FDFC227